jgi:hypothetical protein
MRRTALLRFPVVLRHRMVSPRCRVALSCLRLRVTLMRRTASRRFLVALPRRMVSPRCRDASSRPRIASRCCTALSATLMRRTVSPRLLVALPHRDASPRCPDALSCPRLCVALPYRAVGDTNASYSFAALPRRAVASHGFAAISRPRIASRCCSALSATLVRRTASPRFPVAPPRRMVSPRCRVALSCPQLRVALLHHAVGDAIVSYCFAALSATLMRRTASPRCWVASSCPRIASRYCTALLKGDIDASYCFAALLGRAVASHGFAALLRRAFPSANRVTLLYRAFGDTNASYCGCKVSKIRHTDAEFRKIRHTDAEFRKSATRITSAPARTCARRRRKLVAAVHACGAPAVVRSAGHEGVRVCAQQGIGSGPVQSGRVLGVVECLAVAEILQLPPTEVLLHPVHATATWSLFRQLKVRHFFRTPALNLPARWRSAGMHTHTTDTGITCPHALCERGTCLAARLQAHDRVRRGTARTVSGSFCGVANTGDVL